MKRRAIYIYHQNSAYRRLMAGRLALVLRGAELRMASEKDVDDPEKEVYVMECYDSAENTAVNIAQKFGIGRAANAQGCTVTGFTSAIGGCGCSSAAVVFGRILAQFYELKVLYLSLDRMAVKCSPFRKCGRETVYALLSGQKTAEQIESSFGRDSSGMYYMVADEDINPCSCLDEQEFTKLLSGLCRAFDRIVLDVNVNAGIAFSALELCDYVVVCYGWQEDNCSASEDLFRLLSRLREGVVKFRASFDEDGSRDLFGQFGAEVRELAQSVEG